jgi:hypothetical protein
MFYKVYTDYKTFVLVDTGKVISVSTISKSEKFIADKGIRVAIARINMGVDHPDILDIAKKVGVIGCNEDLQNKYLAGAIVTSDFSEFLSRIKMIMSMLKVKPVWLLAEELSQEIKFRVITAL